MMWGKAIKTQDVTLRQKTHLSWGVFTAVKYFAGLLCYVCFHLIITGSNSGGKLSDFLSFGAVFLETLLIARVLLRTIVCRCDI